MECFYPDKDVYFCPKLHSFFVIVAIKYPSIKQLRAVEPLEV